MEGGPSAAPSSDAASPNVDGVVQEAAAMDARAGTDNGVTADDGATTDPVEEDTDDTVAPSASERLMKKLDDVLSLQGLSKFSRRMALMWMTRMSDRPQHEFAHARGWLVNLMNQAPPRPVHPSQAGCPELLPDLTARPFWTPSDFPWAADITAAFPAIRTELLRLRGQGGFQAYRAPKWSQPSAGKVEEGAADAMEATAGRAAASKPADGDESKATSGGGDLASGSDATADSNASAGAGADSTAAAGAGADSTAAAVVEADSTAAAVVEADSTATAVARADCTATAVVGSHSTAAAADGVEKADTDARDLGVAGTDSGTWNVFYLHLHNADYESNRAKCPHTMAALAAVKGEYQHCFFSAMAPDTHIAAHNGPTNKKLRVHVPLLVPPAPAVSACTCTPVTPPPLHLDSLPPGVFPMKDTVCPACGESVKPGARLRAGEYVHYFREGQLMVFDDSFNHEAWNDAGSPRVVLIFDIWHPDLTPAEVKFLTFMNKAKMRLAKKASSMAVREEEDFYAILAASKTRGVPDESLVFGDSRVSQ